MNQRLRVRQLSDEEGRSLNVERFYDCHGDLLEFRLYVTAAVLRLNRGGPHMPSLGDDAL